MHQQARRARAAFRHPKAEPSEFTLNPRKGIPALIIIWPVLQDGFETYRVGTGPGFPGGRRGGVTTASGHADVVSRRLDHARD